MSWFRPWRRGERPAAPVAAGAGIRRTGRRRQRRLRYHDLDALVEGLRAEVGAAQRVAAEGMRDRLLREIRSLEAGVPPPEDRLAAFAADVLGQDFAMPARPTWMPPCLQLVELTFGAAVEVTKGPDPFYAFVLDPRRPTRRSRRVEVAIRLLGRQPGRVEVLIDGMLLKTIPAPDPGQE